eukprot:Awhi_evm1s12819
MLYANANVKLVVPGDKNYPWHSTGNQINWKSLPSYIVVVRSTNDVENVRSTNDVENGVKCAASYKMTLAAKSGGHSFAGTSQLASGGVLVDFTEFNNVESINVETGLITVQSGILLGRLYALISDAFDSKFIFGGGTCPSVGLAGHVLGGGFGLYGRGVGMSMDQVVGFEVVDAQGRIKQVSQKENHLLFWALKGSCGSFGFVTKIVIQCTQLKETIDGPMVTSVNTPYMNLTDSQLVDFVDLWQRYAIKESPNEYTSTLALHPGSIKMNSVYTGGIEEAKTVLTPFIEKINRIVGSNIVTLQQSTMLDQVMGIKYTKEQFLHMQLPELEKREVKLVKSVNIRKEFLNSHQIKTIMKGLSQFNVTYMEFKAWGGSKVINGFGSYPYRNILFDLHYGTTKSGNYYNPETQLFDYNLIDRDTQSVMTPMENMEQLLLSTLKRRQIQGGYIGYSDIQKADDLKYYYGQNTEKLKRIKKHVDPNNVFNN